MVFLMSVLGSMVFLSCVALVYSGVWYVFSISVLTKLGCIVTFIIGGFYTAWALIEETKIVFSILCILGAVVVIIVFVLTLPLMLGTLAFFGLLAACTLAR